MSAAPKHSYKDGHNRNNIQHLYIRLFVYVCVVRSNLMEHVEGPLIKEAKREKEREGGKSSNIKGRDRI